MILAILVPFIFCMLLVAILYALTVYILNRFL
jgi:hypothetical protein